MKPPKHKKAVQRYWEQPTNDPGPVRGVANAEGHVVGAIYHPEGDPRGYRRATLAPLDKQGRGDLVRFNDRQGTSTHRTS